MGVKIHKHIFVFQKKKTLAIFTKNMFKDLKDGWVSQTRGTYPSLKLLLLLVGLILYF